MKKKTAAAKIAIVPVILLALSSAPSNAFADAQQSNSPPAKSVKSHWKTVPISLAGFSIGVVVGTPICFVRKLPQEAKRGAFGLAQSIRDNTQNKMLIYPAGALWLPAATFVSVLESPGYAFRDAYLAEKPFSKEQFSLGTLDKPKQGLERTQDNNQYEQK